MSFKVIPDGKYHVEVKYVELTRTKVGNKPILKWTFEILDSDYKGELLWRTNIITIKRMKQLKQDLYTCGLKIDNLSDIKQDDLNSFVGIKLDVTKDSENYYYYISFNKRMV